MTDGDCDRRRCGDGDRPGETVGDRRSPLRTTSMFSVFFSYVRLSSRSIAFGLRAAKTGPIEHFDEANHSLD